ncbi:hypothetical protein L6164_000760 [Bauhinia variegata]|uniref:Uncharacterized protein n=1 Tax=Bauhinia variegata TaxID=167791 RepID=A0ACB9Q7M3_BAUVA|nr:hypothetical protein L6164_000760 [Bauhinia variegata]
MQRLPALTSFNSSETEQIDEGGNPPSLLQPPLFNEKVSFPQLETLIICDIGSTTLWNQQVIANSFYKLRVIEILECHKLKCLFTSFMSNAFSSLVEIEVSECSLLETLVLSGGAEFSKLYSLTLQRLPALISFSSSEIEQIDEGGNPPSLLQAPLFNEKVSFPQLETSRICDIGSTTLWNHQVVANSFYKLRVIKVQECHKLKCLFTTSMSKAFSSLTKIEVSECSLLKTLVLSQGVEFFELYSLTMHRLPALTSFSSSETEQIDEGGNPPSLLQAPLFNEKVSFPQLETLIICDIGSTTLWNQQVIANSFCKLSVIEVQQCHKLKCLFTSFMSNAFSSLAEIEVSECSLLETLVLSGGAEFSELYSLTLQRLPALISFSSSETEQIDEGGNPPSLLQAPLFNEKVSFPNWRH